MKKLDRPEALVALERAFGHDGASSLDPRVPAALWRRALCEPAGEYLARPGKNLRAAIVRAGWALGAMERAPREAMPREAMPREAMPHETMPREAMPREAMPHETMPREAMPREAMPRAISTVLELLHAGSLIVDDVEDDSLERRGGPTLHRIVGVPLAINTGSWMYFLALAELAQLGLPGGVELAVRVLVRCHQGQALDLATRIVDCDVADAPGIVATITRWKTGALCGLAGELGALAAGAGAERRAAIATFAEGAGMALQMLDDLSSLATRLDKGREDLVHARATWPWAWLAEHVPAAWPHACEIGREVAAGQGDAGALAGMLVEHVGAIGRAHIRATLAGAVDTLVATIGRCARVDAVVADLERMERSYG